MNTSETIFKRMSIRITKIKGTQLISVNNRVMLSSYICCVLKVLIRDLFHVYLNKCEFDFSRLHVYKINNFCSLLNNRRVPCMTK